MRVSILTHHGKETAIAEALKDAGVEIVHPYGYDYDLILCDSDHPLAPPVPEKHNILKECAGRGIPIVLYPHGAPPDLDYDGLRPTDGGFQVINGVRHGSLPISLRLVSGEGHVEVARRYRCKHRVEAVGWTGCEVVEASRGVVPPASLLFAPIHPWADGEGILEIHRGANIVAYQEFLNHPAEHKTVRMYGYDAPNGITERVDGIDYQQSDLTSGVEVIDAHDAVISYGTLAYTALARGKPTAFIYPYPGHTSDDGRVKARRFDEYKDYLKYPASIGDASLDDLFKMDVSTWKELFVGGPLDQQRLVALLSGFKANRAQRRKLARMR